MILAIDTGNTHTVIGVLNSDNEIVKSFRIPTDRLDTEYGYAFKVKSLLDLEKIDITTIEGAVISSVVPPVTEALKKAMHLITGKEPIVVGQNAISNLEVDVVGGVIAPDLEATAIAAKAYYPLPAIVIDMGTATTVTVLDENGVYRGGVICPGVGTALNAMIEKASLLPSVELVAPEHAIANETTDAIKSGVVYGSAGSIDGIIDHFEQEMKVQPACIVATGGLGGLICRYCRHDIIVNDDLLLKGLGVIWDMNR